MSVMGLNDKMSFVVNINVGVYIDKNYDVIFWP